MNVADTITQMILNWPTLYSSRLDALNRCFAHYGNEVINGELVPEDLVVSRDSDPFRDEEKEVSECHSDIYRESDPAQADAMEAAARIRARRFNVDIQFKLDNAALIAIEEHSDFSSPPTSLSPSYLNRLDIENLNDDWKKALKEYLQAIITYDKKNINEFRYPNERYRKNYEVMLEQTKEVAREGLHRLGLNSAEKDVLRLSAINKLEREAEKFGFKLEKIKPSDYLY